MTVTLLLLLFTFHAGCSTNDYLTRATSSLVLSQVKGDGTQTQATAFVVNIVNKTVSQYHDPLTLTDPVSSAAAPALGDWAIYQRIGYCHGQGDKSLQVVYVNETQEKVLSATLEPAVSQVSGNGSCEQLVLADINGDGASEMITLLSDIDADTVEVVAYENTGNEPSQNQFLGKVILSGAIAVDYDYKMTAGKIRQGNKTDLIAVAAFTQTSVLLWIVGLSSDNQLEAIVSRYEVVNDIYNIDDYCVPMDVVVAYLNDDNGEGTSTLVVAYQESIAGSEITIALRSYQIADGKVVESGTVTRSVVSPSAPPVNISLSVGKIQTTTESQSVVMAMGPYNGPFHLYILKAVNGHLDGSTLWTYIGDQTVFSLSHQISAEVLSDTGGTVAVIDSYRTDTSLEQALYILQVDGTSITGEVTMKWTDTDYTHGYVSAGNMIGLDTWLGPETRFTASLLKDVLMIIEAPPYHTEFRSQYNGNPTVTWSTSTTTDVQVSMSSSSSYTTSNSFGVSIKLFSSSFSDTVEQSMKNTVENTYKSEVKFSEQLQISVSFEDTLLVREISYIVIERPVYIGRKPSGSIIVYQPINKSSNSLSIVSGSYLYYNTSHAVGDIRTYPFGAPTDRNYSIYTDSGTVSFGTRFSFTVTRDTMMGQSQALTREQTSKTSGKVDLKFPFKLEGISGSIGGSYSDSTAYDNKSVNTSSTQLTEQVQISYSIPGYSTSPSQSSAIQYEVIPYIYWDNEGLFHFRWSVNLPEADWDSHITRPDPALLLPYGAEVFKSSRIQHVIFELYITPRTVTRQGESVLIALPIHNYSFKPATNTSIEFYWASTSKIPPDFNSTTDWHHIGTEHIPSIGGFLNETVFIPWIPDSGLKSAVIIVNVVAGSGGDFDTSNNMGYSVWPQDDGNPFNTFSEIAEPGCASARAVSYSLILFLFAVVYFV